ncbi:MAG: radical SAM protein [Candidatus Aenigmarchaeota archaeon]|nr:radical SAM protein [Candidatus Aenigmarchaeota archaeon]
MNLVHTFLTLKFEPEKVRAKVTSIIVEPTVRCNLDCITCSRDIRSRTIKDMTFNEFKEIVDQFPYLIKIAIQGVGEPTLNRDLVNMISYAKGKGIYVYLNTNATLLTPSFSKRLISSGIDLIRLSMDGGTPEIYEKIRRGASFQEFCGNVKEFMKIRGENRIPEVWIWLVLNRFNVNDLKKAVEMTSKLNIKKMIIQKMHTWGNNRKLSETVDLPKDHSNLGSIRGQIDDFAAKEDIEVTWLCSNLLFGKIDEDIKIRRCQEPWYTTYITVEGFVTPCCVHGSDPRLIHFGNIFESNFDSIWNNPKYREFRKLLKSAVPPKICANCPGYSQGILK